MWSFKGSCDIVKRCGEISFCDSTHHLKNYAYKLSAITLIDSEGSTRTVLLSLHLHENADSFKRIFVSWHEAFGCRIPRVILTEGDKGNFAAIASIPYSCQVVHLLCTFHLFDQNVKRRVEHVITEKTGASAWGLFRKYLSICRQAPTEARLYHLWEHLIQD